MKIKLKPDKEINKALQKFKNQLSLKSYEPNKKKRLLFGREGK